MPPNRFESEVESFLEGSHGDRTHIKRADHHTVTPLCGTLLRLPGTHRTVANVITCEVEGFVERVFQACGGASGGEFLAQRAGLRACTHAVSAPVGAIFDRGSPPRRRIVMISVLKSMRGVSG